MSLADYSWLLTGLRWSASVARTVRAERCVWTVREAVTRHSLQKIHCQVLHALRELSAAMLLPEDEGAEIVASLNQRFCTVCKDAMCDHLELCDHQLHCCLKTIYPGKTQRGDKVVTIARSQPYDGREKQSYEAHREPVPVTKNSVWASMAGLSDGVTEWGNPHRCFASNDLVAAGPQFVCSRSGWQNYYRSTLVIPVRYVRDHLGKDVDCLGYLAFDSPAKGAFRGLPEIFDSVRDWEGFAAELEKSATFHLAAILADSLGMAWGQGNEIKQAAGTAEEAGSSG